MTQAASTLTLERVTRRWRHWAFVWLPGSFWDWKPNWPAHPSLDLASNLTARHHPPRTKRDSIVATEAELTGKRRRGLCTSPLSPAAVNSCPHTRGRRAKATARLGATACGNQRSAPCWRHDVRTERLVPLPRPAPPVAMVITRRVPGGGELCSREMSEGAWAGRRLGFEGGGGRGGVA